jgi:hypothetical protein
MRWTIQSPIQKANTMKDVNLTTLNTATPTPSKKPDIQDISPSFSQIIDKTSPGSQIMDHQSSIQGNPTRFSPFTNAPLR